MKIFWQDETGASILECLVAIALLTYFANVPSYNGNIEEWTRYNSDLIDAVYLAEDLLVDIGSTDSCSVESIRRVYEPHVLTARLEGDMCIHEFEAKFGRTTMFRVSAVRYAPRS